MGKILVTIPAELAELAPNYLANRIRDLEALKDALTRKDFESIARLCHKTKGTASGYGFDDLAEFVKQLESAAKSADLERTTAVFERMKSYLNDVEIAPASA